MMSEPNARAIACRVIHATESEGAFADELLARELTDSSLSNADTKLATVITYGTLARRLSIDDQLRHHVKRGLRSVDPYILDVLRMSAFQLLYLDRVPAYAVVDAGVELVKASRPKAAGFANAVLRRLADQGAAATPEGDTEPALAIRHSHPRWLVHQWVAELGSKDAVALMQADNEPNPTALRALIDRERAIQILEERGCQATPSSLAPAALRVRVASGCDGVAVPQSEASQLVCLMLSPRPGDSILDACAAPGGKSAYLATLACDDGRVLAVDPSPRAGQRIRERMKAAGVTNVEIEERRLQELPRGRTFDRVLVDAPCSGLGTLRQHPEIRWRRSEADIEALARSQAELLSSAAAFVKPGGTLVYSTCTIARKENDDVVDGFLEASADFREDIAYEPSDAVAAVLDERGRLRTFPHVHDTDGFFAARLVRT